MVRKRSSCRTPCRSATRRALSTDWRELERQFQQAQRMGAVGRLAGGIAHDFNNVLTVISGYSRLLRGSFEEGDPRCESVATIQQAADSAATLTRQLLAFSRQQVLEPRVLDLNEVVRGAEKMLRHTIGEDIDLKTVLAPEPALVRADPGQLEQVLMNLAVNARDAMPGTGRLVIETTRVDVDRAYTSRHATTTPGAYTRLSVSDSGCGMDEATMARISEPFFSTKEAGKGTGLGLATVYGIVKQTGGFVWAYSEVDHGTTIAIDLPLAEGAPDGATALALVDLHKGPIDLLVSDVVMPGMNGRELAERMVILRPGLPVLFVSGYTDDAVMCASLLTGAVNFIQKPFTPDRLLRGVRSALDT